MNFAALTMLGLAAGLGQAPVAAPPSPPIDYLPSKSRTLQLPIDYKPDQRKSIQQVQLCVSRDQGGTWEVTDAVTPDKDHLVFGAKEDGLYWVNMVIILRDGTKQPTDVTKAPPGMKLLIDATAPVVRVASATRQGDEIAVEWTVEDKFPNDAATQVLYKPTGPGAVGDWMPVPAGSIVKRTAKFKPGVNGPIMVQVVAVDFAGNAGNTSKEVAAGVTAGFSPGVGAGTIVPTAVDPPVAPAPMGPSGGIVVPGVVGSPLPAEPMPTLPSTPPTIPSTLPTAPAVPTMPAAAPAVNPATSPFPVNDPLPGPQPIAVGTGAGVTPTAAVEPATVPVQVIRHKQFDLQYQIDNGPSGVSRVDLYVTRDDGKTWSRWSSHDGRESPLHVVLDTQFNRQLEGDYGFRLVPVSGAGLTDGAPTPGTPPEMRVQVDTTPPMIKVFQPTSDPAQRNALVLTWEATDRNFGRDPIRIEWSESPSGPWKPVTGGEGAVVPAIGSLPMVGTPAPATANRIANSGSFVWQLPTTLNTHKVHLKFSAWDAAGNPSEVITPAVLVDLTKPRAKIQGILPVGGSR